MFCGNAKAAREARSFLNNYPYHILVSEKSGMNRLLFLLFSKTKNNKRPFMHYTRIGYIVLAILQIPTAIALYYLKINIFKLYFWILIALCIIPNVVFVILILILEQKEKAYKKKKGIKTENFWDYLKSDKKFNALEKQWKQEESVYRAIESYIKITNPKKKKISVAFDNIEKINAILEKDFPNAYTELTVDEKGNKVFCVYIRENEDRPVIKAFVRKRI
ncbi:MAG: hypothetical protein IJN65_00030 [Clostridia bacterium]|nr:hypothetical protein [Clostridia bacterium]